MYYFLNEAMSLLAEIAEKGYKFRYFRSEIVAGISLGNVSWEAFPVGMCNEACELKSCLEELLAECGGEKIPQHHFVDFPVLDENGEKVKESRPNGFDLRQKKNWAIRHIGGEFSNIELARQFVDEQDILVQGSSDLDVYLVELAPEMTPGQVDYQIGTIVGGHRVGDPLNVVVFPGGETVSGKSEDLSYSNFETLISKYWGTTHRLSSYVQWEAFRRRFPEFAVGFSFSGWNSVRFSVLTERDLQTSLEDGECDGSNSLHYEGELFSVLDKDGKAFVYQERGRDFFLSAQEYADEAYFFCVQEFSDGHNESYVEGDLHIFSTTPTHTAMLLETLIEREESRVERLPILTD